MHLAEMLALRHKPAAGVFLSLTRRCPLSCAHCSTQSTLASEEQDGEALLQFVRSFTSRDRPEVLLLTGGEPLLRPQLVRDLSAAGHAVGSRVALISGMFFARQPPVPAAIDQAIASVDHFVASLDVFHEREVPRAAVLGVLGDRVERGQDVSLQVVGLGPEDPYLAEVTAEVRERFDDRVPVLVAEVRSVGRAAEWLPQPESTAPESTAPAGTPEPQPCPLAAWPVVAFDGTVVACCNQHVVDGPAPEHLRLGHVAEDPWASVRARQVSAGFPRALRVFGPRYLAHQYGEGRVSCDGYCSTCWRLSDDSALRDEIERLGSRPSMAVTEHQIAGMLQRVPLPAVSPAYAGLAYLGYAASEPEVAS